MKLSRRKLAILGAIKSPGGTATMKRIAENLGWNVNGTSQTLGAIDDKFVKMDGWVGGRRSTECIYRLTTKGDKARSIGGDPDDM
jgi:hypothetical protein